MLVTNSTRPSRFPTKNRGMCTSGPCPQSGDGTSKVPGVGGGGGPGGSTGWGAVAGAASAVGGELQRGDALSQLTDLCSQLCILGGDRGRWWQGDRNGWGSD